MKYNVTAASGGYDSQKLVQGGYIKLLFIQNISSILIG